MSQELHHGEAGDLSDKTHIEMPAPTFFPMVFAFGLTLLVAGMVTHWAVSIVGFIIAAKGVTGWWTSVIPHEYHEAVEIETDRRPMPVTVGARSVVRLKLGEGGHRVRVPERIHPYSAGAWGGLAGGAMMAGLACLYGLIAQHSIWYPVNLLAGVVIPDLGEATLEQLRQFNGLAFVAALIGHGCISVMVGILYAVMLPMFPKYAAFWAGILMPVFWSGLVASDLKHCEPGHEFPNQLAMVCGMPAWLWLGGRLYYCAQYQYPHHAELVASRKGIP